MAKEENMKKLITSVCSRAARAGRFGSSRTTFRRHSDWRAAAAPSRARTSRASGAGLHLGRGLLVSGGKSLQMARGLLDAAAV